MCSKFIKTKNKKITASTDEEDLLVKEISSILPKSSSSETLNIEASSTNVDSLTSINYNKNFDTTIK